MTQRKRVAIDHLFIGLVHVLNVDELDVRAASTLGTEVEYFLRIGEIVNQ